MDQEVPTKSPIETPVVKNDASATQAPQLPATAQSVAKEPGRSAGPCPAPRDEPKRILARALEMEKKTTDPEPHRAIAEAIRMRLDELFQHGCYRRLVDDEHLVEAVAQIAPDPAAFTSLLQLINGGDDGILASYGTYTSAWMGQYRWHEGMVRTSVLVTGERGDMDKQLYVLSAKLAKLPSYPEPVVVLANTHPWMSSCWRALRIRILAPSGDPIHPKALLDKPLSGRWCEGFTTEIKGDTVSFTYESWGGPWSMTLVQRPYTLTYEYKAGAIVEHFGFSPQFENLPEDWLMQEWTLSQEATVESHRGLLQSLHEMLHRTLIEVQKANPSGSDSEYTQEIFPVSDTQRRIVLYCAHRETGKSCKEWPKPVDFFIEHRDGLWYVKDVVPRK
jgi:hypothetical protein